MEDAALCAGAATAPRESDLSRLGELLVRENLISLAQLQKAQEEQRKTGARLGYSLTKLGIINEEELTSFLSKQYGVPSINLSEFDIASDVVQLVPPELAKRHQLSPVNRAGATLIVASVALVVSRESA